MGMYHDSSRVPTPSLLLETMEQAARRADLRQEVSAAEAALRFALDEPVPDLAPGAPSSQLGPGPSDAGPFGPTADLRFEGGERLDDGRTRFGAPDGPRALVGGPLELVAASDGAPAGVLLDGDSALQVDEIGPWGPADPFTLELTTIPKASRRSLVHRTGGTDVGYFGFDLCLVDGYLEAGQFWPGTPHRGLRGARADRASSPALFAQDGTGWAEGMKLWVDGEAGQEELVDALTKPPGIGCKWLSVGARFRGVGIAGGVVHRLRRWDRSLDAFGVGRALDQAHGLGDGGLLRDDARAAAARHLAHRAERMTGLRRALAGARKALLQATMPVLEVPVMAEAPWAGRSPVLDRVSTTPPDGGERPWRAPTSLAPPGACLIAWRWRAGWPRPTTRSRRGSPCLDGVLRPWPGGDAGGSWPPRCAADAPRAPGLAARRSWTPAGTWYSAVRSCCPQPTARTRGPPRKAGPGQHPPDSRTEAAADRRVPGTRCSSPRGSSRADRWPGQPLSARRALAREQLREPRLPGGGGLYRLPLLG